MTATKRNTKSYEDGRGTSVRMINRSRLERSMSVAELARRTDIDKKRLWYILDGQREMRVEEFLKLCVVLKMDPRSFVTRDMVNGIAEATARSIGRAQY
ncbi:helix-turn-helix domain-containing protein [Adlercreutzia muris]|uniref:helix-turn-helix domain-containing protein n=1 Tax=Adlercreutzia muris TaxID=1796610 RepID=UPI001F57B734|nr:helix-turn-helix transcriptional regulator [Adlercreutzia muris]